MTQGMSPSPRLNRAAVRRLAPYAATLLLGFALVALDPNLRVWEFAAAFGLACMVPVLVALLPWASLPRSARLAPIAIFFIALALLRDSVGGASAGVGVVALLPICWLALHGSRRELAVGLAGVAAFWALPVLLIGGAEYPPAQLRSAVMYVAVASLIGLTVQRLVAALAAQASNVARVAAAARSVLSADDARTEICAAACHVSGGSFAFLFEPTGDGRLCSTAMAGITAAPMAMHIDSELSATGIAFVSRRSSFVKHAAEHPTIDHAMKPDADARQLVPRRLLGRRLREPDVLGEVGGGEHPVLADDRDLAALLRREPVDVEQPEGAVVAEAQQAGDHVLLRGVRQLRALRVDARDVAPEDELHDVEVVRGQVDGDAGVLDAQGHRADARGVRAEDAADAPVGDRAPRACRPPG